MRYTVAARALVALTGAAVGLAGCASASGSGGAATTPATNSASVSAPAPGPAAAGTTKLVIGKGRVVPAPHPGNIHRVAPARKIITRLPVGLHEAAAATRSVSVRLASIRSIRTVAQGPGEVAGSGLAVRIRISNAGRSSVNLGNVVVNLSDAKGRPAVATSGAPAMPFAGVLQAGHSATATYVFTVASNDRTGIHVSVAYAGDAPVVVFAGDAS